MIQYAAEVGGASIQDSCYLLSVDEFDSLVDPPSVTRIVLGWDSKIVGLKIIFLYGKRGYTGWYVGCILGYDSGTQEHTIQPIDKTGDLVVNLLACQKAVIQEWRLLLANEDGATVCSKLNE